MANNRLYLVARPKDDEPKCILLAKGWSSGWQLWEPDTLAERLVLLLARDYTASNEDGLGEPLFTIEDEATMSGNTPELIHADGGR